MPSSTVTPSILAVKFCSALVSAGSVWLLLGPQAAQNNDRMAAVALIMFLFMVLLILIVFVPGSGLYPDRGHHAALLEVADPGEVSFCPMAVLPSWRDALCQSSVWEPLEGGIYPAKTETLLYNNEVRQCVGHRFFAPINGHPAVMRRRVVLLQPSPQLLPVTVFQKNVNLHYRRDSMSKYAAKIQLFCRYERDFLLI